MARLISSVAEPHAPHPPAKTRARVATATAAIATVVVAVFLVAEVFTRPEIYQWDFRTYYYASRARAAGLDPYNPDDLLSLAGGGQVLQFVYPPFTLAFFAPLAALSYGTAYHLWLFLKLILLAALVLIWRRYLFREEPLLSFSIFLLLGFGSALYIDLATGNVSILEQALLWTGIACLLKGRAILFCSLTLAASVFKVTPLGFVLLLPLLGEKRGWGLVTVSVAALATAFGVGGLIDPDRYARFWSAALSIRESGAQGNPSMLSVIGDLAARVGTWMESPIPRGVTWAILAVVGAGILAISLRALARIKARPREQRFLPTVFLFCATYALILPRFKSYSFILLLPPALYALRRGARLPAYWYLFALGVLTVYTPLPVRLPCQSAVNFFWLYYPLVLAFAVWWMLIADSSKLGGPSGESELRTG